MKILPNIIPFNKQTKPIKWEAIQIIKDYIQINKHELISWGERNYFTKKYGNVRAFDIRFISSKTWKGDNFHNHFGGYYVNNYFEFSASDIFKINELLAKKYKDSRWVVLAYDHYRNISLDKNTTNMIRIKIYRNII